MLGLSGSFFVGPLSIVVHMNLDWFLLPHFCLYQIALLFPVCSCRHQLLFVLFFLIRVTLSIGVQDLLCIASFLNRVLSWAFRFFFLAFFRAGCQTHFRTCSRFGLSGSPSCGFWLRWLRTIHIFLLLLSSPFPVCFSPLHLCLEYVFVSVSSDDAVIWFQHSGADYELPALG